MHASIRIVVGMMVGFAVISCRSPLMPERAEPAKPKDLDWRLMHGLSVYDHRRGIDARAVQGIDVSHHQGDIDWKAVRADGIAFAYLKATEGVTFSDPRFKDHWRDAARAGLARGAYHFFTFCRDAGEQAANFLAAVPIAADALPPAVDLEFGGNCATRPAPDAVCASVRTFVDKVEAATGKTAILYVTDESLPAYGACLPDRPIWFRPLTGGTPSSTSVRVWQFNDQTFIRGIQERVDLNAFLGEKAEFERFRGEVK